jgi:hypothetical protein
MRGLDFSSWQTLLGLAVITLIGKAAARVRAVPPQPVPGWEWELAWVWVPAHRLRKRTTRMHTDNPLADFEQRVARLRAAYADGDVAAREALLKPAHDRRRFERFDPHADSISEADARLLIANAEGYAYWSKYESYLNLQPSVQRVIEAVESGDRASLQNILRAEPWAANPRWIAGFAAPTPVPNDSIPLFCVSEGVFNKTNTRGNEYDLVQDLARAGADFETQGGLPIAGAVSFGTLKAVAAFLDCGANVDGVDNDGTLMAYALHFTHREVAELLAARGAQLDLRFAAGLGRLDAVKSAFNPDGSLQPGAGRLVDPYALERKMRGESPFRCERTRPNILSQALYFACIGKHLDVAEFLLAQGADVNAIVPGLDWHVTVLQQTLWRDLHDVAAFLRARGATA